MNFWYNSEELHAEADRKSADKQHFSAKNAGFSE